MSRIPIELDSFNHVYNRGVDKRIIFEDDDDRELFLKFVNILNDVDTISPSRVTEIDQQSPKINQRLVDVCAFCLMPNHFHFLLHEKLEGGIGRFMQRIGTAYTLYFNEKYERSGSLFQGTYKCKEISELNYLMSVIDYIHLNPIQHHRDGVNEIKEGSNLSSLMKYFWSSFRAYTGDDLHRELLQRECLKDVIDIPGDYTGWLASQHDFEVIKKTMFD